MVLLLMRLLECFTLKMLETSLLYKKVSHLAECQLIKYTRMTFGYGCIHSKQCIDYIIFQKTFQGRMLKHKLYNLLFNNRKYCYYEVLDFPVSNKFYKGSTRVTGSGIVAFGLHSLNV